MKVYFDEVIEPLNKELGRLLNTKQIPVRHIETETQVIIYPSEYKAHHTDIFFFERKRHEEAPF